MVDPAETSTPSSTTPDVADVAAARQPNPGAPGWFRRTFVLPLHAVADEVIKDIALPMHEWNLREVHRDAVRRGLRATGDATVDEVVQRDDQLTEVTYAVPVAPTVAAVAVSTAGRNGPVRTAPTAPEPDTTDASTDAVQNADEQGDVADVPEKPAARHAAGDTAESTS